MSGLPFDADKPKPSATPAKAAKSDGPKLARHRWVKLKIHVYICVKCGMGKVNHEEEPNWWRTTYKFPDGTERVEHHTPPCAKGKHTELRLSKVQHIIDEKLGPKKPGWEPPF